MMSRGYNEAILLIKDFEGFSARPYLCPAKKWTIGFGHTTWKGKPVTANTPPISYEEGELALIDDLRKEDAGLDRLVTVPLNDGHRAALLSWVWNLGLTNLSTSTLLKTLNAGDYFGAAEQFGRWINSGGQVLDGLVKRRRKEANVFCRGAV